MSKIKKILIVVGTRPNFVKITQFPEILKAYPDRFEFKIIHTGQHSDDKMSKVFFDQFGITPDIFLNTESGDANIQIANIRSGLRQAILDYNPDLIIVVGDVNSTLAAAIAAKELKIKIAHVESGLRSFDKSMPEERNRIATDNVTDHFFVTEQSGINNLIEEGKSMDKIYFVGNTMIDTMIAYKTQIDSSDILTRLGLHPYKFVLMTMHRPATVDSLDDHRKLIDLINAVSEKYKIVFPIHPRTTKRLIEFNLKKQFTENVNLIISDPLDYFSFQKLIKECKFVITDSGGIQEESTFLQVPCLTLRPNTERPATVTAGTNELIQFAIPSVLKKIKEIEDGVFKRGNIPEMWDGKATHRIVDILLKILKE